MLAQTDLEAFSEFERAGWKRSGQAYHALWGALTNQSVAPLLEAARVGPGAQVVDVASGPGYIAAAAAKRGASVIGTDFSPEQVALARKTFPDVPFELASADELPVEDATCDAVVVGFGVNHLPEPEQAFREAARVLRSGGWFAFTVWASPEENPGFNIVMSAIAEFGEEGVTLPPAPPYFRFADAELARDALHGCGFSAVESQLVPQLWLHDTTEQLFDAFDQGAVRARAMLRVQPEAARVRIRDAVSAEVAKLRQGAHYVIPVPAMMTWAQKP